MVGTDLIFQVWLPERKMLMHPKDILTFHEETITGGPTIGQMKKWVYLQWSGWYDKNAERIFNGDVVEIVNDAGKTIRAVCRYGLPHRVLDTGHLVEISGFYFEVEGRATFPIVNNYAGKHDCAMFKKIGNIYPNPELIPSIFDIDNVPCCGGAPEGQGCVCGKEEKVIRALISGTLNITMAPYQREWCISEAKWAGEGMYSEEELKGMTDKQLAEAVLTAWIAYANSNT